MMKTISVVIFSLLLSGSAMAAVSPLAVSIFPPVQFPPDDYDVAGLRLNLLVGKHRSVYGLDFGVVGNITTQKFAGLAVAGLFNRTFGRSDIVGLQVAGLSNINTERVNLVGFQVALMNYNSAASTISGFQIGPLANLSTYSTVYGAQIGIYNSASEVYGFQIGLFNETTDLHGLQIGVINIHKKGLFYVCPIINMGF
jgi:hypothetical protein